MRVRSLFSFKSLSIFKYRFQSNLRRFQKQVNFNLKRLGAIPKVNMISAILIFKIGLRIGKPGRKNTADGWEISTGFID